MSSPKPWQGEAFNQAFDSKNEIHSDEMAQRFGFKGGLVPGVTVSAYLIHPAIEAWGLDWLRQGWAHAVVRKPIYDRSQFKVELHDSTEQSYQAKLLNEEGLTCAIASVKLPQQVPSPPKLRGDPLLYEGFERTQPNYEAMLSLQRIGLHALCAPWNETVELSRYCRDPNLMPKLLQFNQGGGYANPAFTLGVTNWILQDNIKMNPWVHLESESQNYQAIPLNSEIIVEAAISDLFEKKGHQFVDADVNLFLRETQEAVMSARLRAIYRLRGS
jgi:hypothetical protein